jgi:hypothetical protein
MIFDLYSSLQLGCTTIPKSVVSKECHVIGHAALLARRHIGTGRRLDAGGSECTTRTQCRRNQATLERDQIH